MLEKYNKKLRIDKSVIISFSPMVGAEKVENKRDKETRASAGISSSMEKPKRIISLNNSPQVERQVKL